MLEKVHKKLYNLPQILKFFYVVCLTSATVDFFVDQNHSIWSILTVGVMTAFNYCILITPKK